MFLPWGDRSPKKDPHGYGAMVKAVKAAKVPCAVGFGISTPEQAKKMAAVSDGAIVGIAIVKLCAAQGENCVPYVKEYVKSMKDAIKKLIKRETDHPKKWKK